MTRQEVQRVFDELPQGEARLLASAKPHLLEIAEDVPEEVIGIVCASPHAHGNSALVITPSRIIEMTTGGTMQVFAYSELSAIRAVGGRKKLFGGHEQIFLLVDSQSGGTITYPLFGEHERNFRLSAEAEAACKRYRLKAT